MLMQQIELNVDGMTCHGCSGRLQRVLEATAGVSTAQVVLDTQHVTVDYDDTRIDPSVIYHAITDAGFSVISA